MFRKLAIRNSAVVIVLGALFYGCINLATLGMGRVIKPEESKHYEPQGALVALTVNTTRYGMVETCMMMFDDTSSYTMHVTEENNYLLLDVPVACTGLGRIGVIIQNSAYNDWFDIGSKFKLDTNKVNYLGRFIFEQDLNQSMWDKVTITNTMDHDKKWFAEYYPNLTNYEFINVPVSNGIFRTE